MFVPVLLLLSALAAEDPLPEADPRVTRGALEHHVRFLASDELRGRAAATPESRRVSAYLARALERAGVTPAGAEGNGAASYFQPVPLMVTSFERTPELVLDGERVEEYGDRFAVRFRGDPADTGDLLVRVVREEGDVPEAADPGSALVMHASRLRSLGWLEDAGFEDGAGFGLILHARIDREEGRPAGVPRRRITTPDEAEPDLPERVSVYGELARTLWEGEVERVRLVSHGARRVVDERNVVGLVPGVGAPDRPELADEVVVLSAHFDHIGVLPEGAESAGTGEDRIRNGADDDASGTAVLLELAEALAAGDPPARTVLLLFCAAEERGMLGTVHWVEHPTVPLERVVCNLNLEMLGMPDPIMGGPGRSWLTGFERSNLGPALREHGVDVGPDQRPEMRFFQRSDNFVFVKEGIVGQTLSSGGDNPNYHRVTDEADTLDFGHLRTCAEVALAATRLLADGTITPSWNEGEPDLSR